MIPLPEPSQFAPQMITEDAYTRDQLIEYGRACADAERERCAKACESGIVLMPYGRECAAAIRALKDE